MPASDVAAGARPVPPGQAARRSPLRGRGVALLISGAALVAACLLSLCVGRFGVPPRHVLSILLGQSGTGPAEQTEHDVVLLVRLPRVLLGVLVGGGLSISGAALQAVLRNPLVSPQIIGVSSGASFGGVLALVLGLGSGYLVGFAFAFGLAALGLVFLVTVGRDGAPLLMIVLAGVVVGSFFSALVSLVTYVADPYDQLPSIVFWLLGSLASATWAKVLVAAVPVLAGCAVLLLLRWRVNVLTLGDDDAASVGLRPGPTRWAVLAAVTLIVAGAVAVSGVVSWVGLLVPHLARMWVGPDHRVLLPMSFTIGATYLVLVDTLARSLTAAEIPLGVLTALLGAPAFFLLLRANAGRIWDRA